MNPVGDPVAEIEEENNELLVDVDEFIKQLNGVDPSTIQVSLAKETGKFLTIKEILNKMK